MFPNSDKMLILIAAGLVTAFLVLIVALPSRPKEMGQETMAPSSATSGTSAGVVGNAFVPNSGLSERRTENPTSNVGNIPNPNGITSYLKNLENALDAGISLTPGVSIAPTSSPPDTLALPPVPDSDISIDQTGQETTQDYLIYFAGHSNDVNFDYRKFGSVLKNKGGIPLLIGDLIDLAISQHDFRSVHESLAVERDFISGIVAFTKTIKVRGEAIAASKNNLALEQLTLNLIDKAFDVESGRMTESDFRNYYAKYKNTALSVHNELAGGIDSFSLGRQKNFFDRVFGFFGLRNVAYAVVPTPFGGLIPPGPTSVLPCPPIIPFGLTAVVGPPVPSVVFFSWVLLADPATFYPFYTIAPGAYVLGMQLITPGNLCGNTGIFVGTSVLP